MFFKPIFYQTYLYFITPIFLSNPCFSNTYFFKPRLTYVQYFVQIQVNHCQFFFDKVKLRFTEEKDLFNMSPGCIVDGDFLLPNEIDSWNFQHMLHFWFRDASQNLSSFRQLFFHSGPKEKCWKIAKTIHWFFSTFHLVPPLETMKTKLSKWAQILRGFTKLKMKHMLKISAVYLIGK